jgi:aminoglycoside phosphotransferase (APT) family kinase protein
MSAPAAPPVVRDVSAALLAYLQQRLQAADLCYRQALSAIPDGWETNTYCFQVASRQVLPIRFTGPLILRAYTSRQGLRQLRHEFAVQRHLGRHDYPVAAPLLEEEDSRILGGPFMLMECVPGQTLLEFLLHHPVRILSIPRDMADLHYRLHTLSVNDFPAPPGDFLARSLERLQAVIGACHFDGMLPALDWLWANRPGPPGSPSIVHLDFHPANLMIHEGSFRAVLDWSHADLGDYHADVASTLMLIDAAPVRFGTLWRRLLSVPGQIILRNRYLRGYRAHRTVDQYRLRYYQAWAAFRRLCLWGQWHYAGPETTGAKPAAAGRASLERLHFLACYVEKYSGVAVRLRPVNRGSSLVLA